VDHATVGRRSKSLEKVLGANLFDRSPSGYTLTEAGQRLVDRAEAIETAAVTASSEFGSSGRNLGGSVRIGAPDGVATYLLAEVATELCRAHPQLELQIVTLHRQFSLLRREVDIAITVSAPDAGRVKVRKIADYTLHLYTTRNYPALHPGIESVADLKQVRGIAYVPELIHDKELDYITMVAPDIRPHLASTSVHVQLAATLADGGVCILHDFMPASHPGLVRVLGESVAFRRSFWLIVHEDYAKLERIRAVSQAITAHIRRRLAAPIGED